MIDERRYWFVIDKGKLEYVQDNVAGEKITVSELEDLLNEQDKEIGLLRHELDSLTGCYCADNKEFKDYWRIGYDD